jgi:hypothetical protein
VDRGQTVFYGITTSVKTEISSVMSITATGSSRSSLWRLPDFFSPKTGRTLSYHTAPERWKQCHQQKDSVLLDSVGRGQEFVFDAGDDSDVTEWLITILTGDY